MGIFDAIIIYLACGAPFAVYRIAIADMVSPRVVGKSTIYLLLWPILALRFVLWHLPRVTFRRRSSVAEIRVALEAAAFGETTIERRLRFRDVYDEYVAFQTAMPTAGGFAFLELSGHPDLRLATACLTRRAFRGLEQGRASSHDALLEVTNADTIRDPSTLALLNALAEVMGDTALRARLGPNALTTNDSLSARAPVSAGR